MRRICAALTAMMLSLTLLQVESATASDSVFDKCGAAEFRSGACLTAVTSGGTSPLQAAVAQAIARGETAQADQFVRLRGRLVEDTEQKALRGILQRAKQGGTNLVAGAGSGTISGYIHIMADTATYFYCAGSDCRKVGRVTIDMRMNIIDYPANLLAGEFAVKEGPAVDFTQIECISRLDRNNLPDTTVFTWSSCTNAHNRDTYTYRALVNEQTWRQGGTKGEKYYNRYRMTFKPNAGSRPTLGPFEWETKRWYIPTTAGAYPYWLA